MTRTEFIPRSTWRESKYAAWHTAMQGRWEGYLLAIYVDEKPVGHLWIADKQDLPLDLVESLQSTLNGAGCGSVPTRPATQRELERAANAR